MRVYVSSRDATNDSVSGVTRDADDADSIDNHLTMVYIVPVFPLFEWLDYTIFKPESLAYLTCKNSIKCETPTIKVL